MIFGFLHGVRLMRAGYVLAREGVFSRVDPAGLPGPVFLLVRLSRLIERRSQQASPSMVVAMSRLGPTYVKLGQFLATRPDIVGTAIARDLEQLQDRMASFPQAEAEAVVSESLGRPLREAYVAFGPAVAAASIAQVHRATVRDATGERDVAVKVLRPGVAQRFRADLADLSYAAAKAERWFAEARRLRVREVVDTLARSVVMEMDLRLEAAALSEMAENTRDDLDFRVPSVDWDRTARDVLTMEWIAATPLNDRAALERNHVDGPALARTIIQAFLRHSLRDGFFHADMHPGNLFVDAEGRLVAVDFGIMGRLGVRERRFLAEILFGFIRRDYQRVAEVHFEAGYVPAHHSVENFAQAIRAIGEPIHNRAAEDISMARLLTLLFEVTGLFDMQTRPELVMLQKTMVVVEGVARGFDPKLDMWSTAEPVVGQWIELHLGPLGRARDALADVGRSGRMLAALPDLLATGARVLAQVDAATRNGIHLAPETVAALSEAERRAARNHTLALWALAAAVIVLVVNLLRAV